MHPRPAAGAPQVAHQRVDEGLGGGLEELSAVAAKRRIFFLFVGWICQSANCRNAISGKYSFLQFLTMHTLKSFVVCMQPESQPIFHIGIGISQKLTPGNVPSLRVVLLGSD